MQRRRIPSAALRTLAAAAALAVLAIAGCGGSDSREVSATPSLSILSSKPEFVSGDDALVRVSVPPGTALADVALTLNGTDVTAQLTQADAAAGTLTGLVRGMALGANTLEASVRTPDRDPAHQTLQATNHPITGPILAGPLMTPYECRTVESGMGAPLDADCTATRRIDYFYRASDNSFKPLADPLARPVDLLNTTTNAGATVPYIVRVDSGTVNRTIYRIAVLDDPSAASVDPDAWKPTAGWNGKLVVSFGGGAGTQYNQGVNQVTAGLSDLHLARGFAFMVSTELVNGQRGNAVLQGETLMMLKEYFAERYGVPKWTAGTGGSGGAIQQLVITQMYPGLLDGLQPSATFPDGSLHVTDCRLLENVYKADLATWTDDKRAAVDGFTNGTCRAWDLSFVNTIVATNAAGCALNDTSLIYNPVTNPSGARCTTSDMRMNVLGRDPVTGFARSPLDNVGIQYGLLALNAGAIGAEEFVHLNEQVGGYDKDGNVAPQRTVGDLTALTRSYESGLVNSGGGGLANVPILQSRNYTDAAGDIHSHERDLVVRARLQRTNGRSDNQVIWVAPRTGFSLAALSLDTMNEWLDRLAADPAPLSTQKVVNHKPAAATDACFGASGERFDESPQYGGTGTCATMYPVHSEPRQQAGAPWTNDVNKCQLQPIDYAAYTVSFSDAQKARLAAVFPDGVCDWSKPSQGHAPLKGSYQKY